MPTWVNIVLTCFYIVWLLLVLGLLFVIWRNGVRRSEHMEQALMDTARESAHAAMIASDAVAHLVMQHQGDTDGSHVHAS